MPRLLSFALLTSALILPGFALAQSSVREVNGSVVLFNSNGSNASVAAGQTFAQDATVRLGTTKGSTARIELTNGSVVLRENTIVRIENGELFVESGTVEVVGGNSLKVATGESQFVVTGESVIGVGTKDGKAVAAINVTSGTASVVSSTGSSTVAAGGSASVSGGQASVAQGPVALPTPTAQVSQPAQAALVVVQPAAAGESADLARPNPSGSGRR